MAPRLRRHAQGVLPADSVVRHDGVRVYYDPDELFSEAGLPLSDGPRPRGDGDVTWELMSEGEPDEGANVVVQTADGGPLFFGYVRSRHVHGSLECSPGPVSFRLVHR